MLRLTKVDKEIIDDSYNAFLENLYNFLKNSNATSGIDYAKVIIRLLHSGKFGMNGNIVCKIDYDYLYLPNLSSDGMLVMYGVCCCRHATSLLHDVLCGLGFDASFYYIRVQEDDDTWHRATLVDANHIVVHLKERDSVYLIDPVNSYILKREENNDLTQLGIDEEISLDGYDDSNVEKIGKVLSKYYNLKRLGVEHIYDC